MTSPLLSLTARVRAALVAAAVATIATVTVLALPSPEGDRRPDIRYAALGDSYAAGVGAGRYSSDAQECHRSANAYGPVWAKVHTPAAFTFLACSGAITEDVVRSQLPYVPEDTTLVTLSVGGNDAGFAAVLASCSLDADTGCATTTAAARWHITTTFPALLADTYAAIRHRAPSARILVFGYPRLYEDGPCPQAVSEFKRAAINNVAVVLNDTLRAAAEKAGAEFIDVAQGWEGHGVCGVDAWINPLTYPVGDSMHPTAIGQRHILELLEAATRRVPDGPLA